MKTILFFVTTLFSSHALAIDAAGDVTDAQVAFYQLGIETGCKDTGRSKGDPTEKVDAFCSCVMRVLKDDVTFAEWQQAYFYSIKRQGREEMRVMGPHMSKTQTCRSNAF